MSIDLSTLTNSRTHNTSIKIKEKDRKKVKVFCHEPYAQSMYDSIINALDGRQNIPNKDLALNTIYKVVAKSLNFENSTILCEEVDSLTSLTIPFKEFTKDLNTITGINKPFFVLTAKNKTGQTYASEKKALSYTYRNDLQEAATNNTFFDVKIIKLIRGGFLALYKDTVECFLPGGLAAANVIFDFNSYIGKIVPVMIDTYDTSNNLFIVSYKKYIKETLSSKIETLSFNKLYTGRLTTKPYDFGMFIEIDEYFTGLISSSDIENYEHVKKQYSAGQEVEIYIKDITYNKGTYRISLTFDQSRVNTERAAWSRIKDEIESRKFNYEYDSTQNTITILTGDEPITVNIGNQGNNFNKDIKDMPLVLITKVDVLNKRVKFEFVRK